MITEAQMIKALFALESYGLMAVRDGQAPLWLDLINEAAPTAEYPNLMQAVRNLAVTRTTEGRGGAWITVGDLIAQLRIARRAALELEERQARQIESGSNSPVSIDIKRLMAEARSGMTPEEIGKRARERAEGTT